jgi:hypothetical protein
VLKVMILDRPLDEVEGREAELLHEPAGWKVFLAVTAAMIFVVGLAWGPLADMSRAGVDHFRDVPPAGPAAVARAGEKLP